MPLLLLFQKRIEEKIANRPPTMRGFAGMALIGLVAGFLVGMTSVGSGSIIMMLLLLFYSFPPKVNVGTDIVHAVIFTGVTGFMHFRAGNVDPYSGDHAADRLGSGRPGRVAPGHTRPHAVAAPPALRPAADYRRPHVVGIISKNNSGTHDFRLRRHSETH